MKALIQRVLSAKVVVDGKVVGSIDNGVLCYLGIGRDDTLEQGKRLIDKVLTYRIFENELGKLDKSVVDVGGGLLIVSQFTLMAYTDKGRRPDFGGAMNPADAKVMYDALIAYTKEKYPSLATGQFGANMQVTAVNDGPINFILEV